MGNSRAHVEFVPLSPSTFSDTHLTSCVRAQQTDVVCDKCGCREAYFMQIQIRSADEPMTTFYRCTNMKCNFIWREG